MRSETLHCVETFSSSAWSKQLQSHIRDTVISIHGYNLIRRDRTNGQHGGVSTYISDDISYKAVNDLNNDQFEVLCFKLNIPRLPRGYNNLVIGTVHHPPSANRPAMLNYLSSYLSTLESRFSNCGMILLGDFNKLNNSRLNYNYNMRHFANFPTWGSNILNLVLTNLYDFYKQPGRYPPFGLCDYMYVILNPKVCCRLPKAQKTVIMKRD